NLFIMPIARSVAPSSNAPASEVTGPASNAATTLRPSTGANSKKFGVQSVGIGVLRESEINCCCTTIFADSQPRCTQFGERSALDRRTIAKKRIQDHCFWRRAVAAPLQQVRQWPPASSADARARRQDLLGPIGQMTQYSFVGIVLRKPLQVLEHAELFEPVRNLLHRREIICSGDRVFADGKRDYTTSPR